MEEDVRMDAPGRMTDHQLCPRTLRSEVPAEAQDGPTLTGGPRTIARWLLSCPRAEISQTDTFPFLRCVMLGSGGNITITYSRKYVLEREKAEPAYWLT